MKFGFVKSTIDVHTLGMNYAAELLRECGYEVVIGDAEISRAIEKIEIEKNFRTIKNWLLSNKVTHFGYSYRLDPGQAAESFEKILYKLRENDLFYNQPSGIIKEIYFAGLPEACSRIKEKFKDQFVLFYGDESEIETLRKFRIPNHKIPHYIQSNSVYDDFRNAYAKEFIESEQYKNYNNKKVYNYTNYGSTTDSVVDRLKFAKSNNLLPLTRVHVGPYDSDRKKALELFNDWLKKLADCSLLDVVSIGSSQLSQSNFGEDWSGLSNGGGVPFNSELELVDIFNHSRPMLLRAYSATNNVPEYSAMLEKTINICWHALSLWWFNKIDGRGPLSVMENLKQHLETLNIIAATGKPFEPNIPHHFAFRGSDDVTYVVSAYLAAKAAKRAGVKFLVLQNMLNTPKATTGIADLVKGRTMLRLVKELEDESFKVFYQPRAGLDYFSPDLEKAKIQLASVSALMDDIDFNNEYSPDIIHVVSYSEAVYLADPPVIEDSLNITLSAIKDYRKFKHKKSVAELINNDAVFNKESFLAAECKELINHLEKTIPNLYSYQGFYKVLQMGYFPVPHLWECREEFSRAVNWSTKNINGQMVIVNKNNKQLSIKERIEIITTINNYPNLQGTV